MHTNNSYVDMYIYIYTLFLYTVVILMPAQTFVLVMLKGLLEDRGWRHTYPAPQGSSTPPDQLRHFAGQLQVPLVE